jgi:hypothetical protein
MLKKGGDYMKAVKGKKQPQKVRLQIQVRTEIGKAIRRRAVDQLTNVSKLLTEWVDSWEKR